MRQLILHTIDGGCIRINLVLESEDLFDKFLKDLVYTKVLCISKGTLTYTGRGCKENYSNPYARTYINMNNVVKWNVINNI